MARHRVFIVVCFHVLGAVFSSAVIDTLCACDLVNGAHYEHVIDKASTGRLDHSVQCCADLIRELVMVLRGEC